MRLSDFTYELPEERIALFPPKTRGSSRLLVLGRSSGTIKHDYYANLDTFLKPGDLLIINDTKVIKARLVATNTAGKQRELLLLEQHGTIDPYKRRILHRGKIRPGEELFIDGEPITVLSVHGDGTAEISAKLPILELAERYGNVPLPPYMHREANETDNNRYQTVFAEEAGSVAAPTASLNFTEELEAALLEKGVLIEHLTLHVGLGTFLPIRTDKVEEHSMHSEYFSIPAKTIEALSRTKKAGGRIIALGTTVTRTLEYCANQVIEPGSTGLSGEADIFIYPGYRFKLVDGMLTNFHAPKSTVLMMAAAFGGWDNLMQAYKEAIEKEYAFLSYGDSMLII